MSNDERGGTWTSLDPPLGLDLGGNLPIDPYLVWAMSVNFVGYSESQPDGHIAVTLPFLMEFQGADGDAWTADAAQWDHCRELLLALVPSITWAPKSRYHTAIVSSESLKCLVDLLQHGVLRRFQLGAARGRPLSTAVRPHLVQWGLRPQKTLGVIDDGCCFAHHAYRSIGPVSRFAFIWDQNPRGPYPFPWARLHTGHSGKSWPLYGSELDTQSIEKLLSAYPALGEEGERALYRAIDRPAWGNADRTHGARVLHTLAGPVSFLPPKAPIPGLDAATLPIIFVQLPDQSVADTSGGSIGFYVLDGVRYIIQRTKEASHPCTNWSTTINVSLGSQGGPHDGTTIVERALDETVDLYGSAVRIILAAGNIAGHAIHAVREVSATRLGRFDVMVPPDNQRESLVELWPQLHRPQDVDHLQVRVSTPDGSILSGARVGSLHVLRNRLGLVVALLVFPRVVPQSLRGTMILLAILPTETSEDPEVTAPAGVWSLVVESSDDQPVAVHAWIERNDTVIGRRVGQRTVFLDDVAPGEQGGYLSDDSTLSSIANGAHTDAVGAFEINRSRITDYSSRGPVLGRTDERPEIFGASDTSSSLTGIRCSGFFSGTRAKLSGTSAAAPRVARWIAEGSDPAKIIPLDPGQSSSAKPAPIGVQPIDELDDLA